MSLIPYDAAAHTLITKTDLDLLATQGPAMAFVSKTARGWLQFWNDDVGQPGFYPFDWVAAAYLVDPASFDCAFVQARVLREWAFWMLPRKGLLVDAQSDRGPPSSVTYCPQTAPSLHDQLISQPDPSLKAD